MQLVGEHCDGVHDITEAKLLLDLLDGMNAFVTGIMSTATIQLTTANEFEAFFLLIGS